MFNLKKMRKVINLANITVMVYVNKKAKTLTHYKVPYLDGQEYYRGNKIVSLEILGVMGKTNY